MVPVTLKMVAARAGVSLQTVSRALRDQDRISPETKAHVLRVARELGYRPNAAGVALRKTGARAGRELRVAILVRENRPDLRVAWETVGRKLGYAVTLCPLESREWRGNIGRLLWQRGLTCLIIDARSLEVGEILKAAPPIDWNRFTVLKLSNGLEHLPFHHVCYGAFRQALQCFERAFAAGYRRIGYVYIDSSSHDDDRHRLGAAHVFRAEHGPRGARVFFFKSSPGLRAYAELANRGGLRAWIKRHRLDVVVSFPGAWAWALLPEAGFKVPDDVAFVGFPAWPARIPEMSGSVEHYDGHALEVALRMLGEQIAKGERGLPAFPHGHVLEAGWYEGKTLPTRA